MQVISLGISQGQVHAQQASSSQDSLRNAGGLEALGIGPGHDHLLLLKVLTELLLHGDKVGNALAGMLKVIQGIDDGDRSIFSNGADHFTAHAQLRQVIDPDQQTVQIAAQDLGGVRPGLLVGQLHLCGVIELCVSAQLGQAGFKGNAGTSGGVCKDHAEALVFQQFVVTLAAVQLVLQIQSLVNQPLQLCLGQIHNA